MIGFGNLLVVLSVVLYESHEHAPSLIDTVAEKPEQSLLAILGDEYEPRTRSTTDTHDAEGTPPSDTMGGPATSEEERANGRAVMGDGSDGTVFRLETANVLLSAGGGILAGRIGIAIGELTQTMLALRRRVLLKLYTGTSALVLHATIVAVLLANIALLAVAPSVTGDGFTVPFLIGSFVATGCLLGGQVGTFLKTASGRRRSCGCSSPSIPSSGCSS